MKKSTGLLRLPALVLLALVPAACDGGSTAAEPPLAPTAVQADAVSATAIELTWTSDGASSFEIERATGNGSFEPLTSVGGNARSYLDTGLEPDQTYRYRIEACNGDLCSAAVVATARTLELLAITDDAVGTAVAGQGYEETITADGGDGSYTWDITSGSLPAGLSLTQDSQGNAVISGTPQSEGSSTFTLRVRSGDGQSVQTQLTIEVTPEPPPAPTNLTVESATMTQVTLSWSVSASPPSFRLERAVGVMDDFSVLATPGGGARSYTDSNVEQNETYRYRIRACDGDVCSAPSATVTARTPAELRIVTTALDPAILGQSYTESVIAEGGDGNLTWDIVSGSLPAGLALGEGEMTQNAIISGTPDAEGSFTFTVRVRSGDGQTDQQQLTLTVMATAPVKIETVRLPPVVVTGLYNVRLRAVGGDGENYAWSVAEGSLPPGLSVEGDSINGSPSSVGTFDVVLRVTSADQSDTAPFTIQVVPYNPDGYDITPYPVADIPSGIQPHVDEAIAQWEEVITGNLQEIAIPIDFFGSNGCFGFGDALNGTSIDDILMIINIDSIDGPGQVLGQAGPCVIRGDEDALPIAGVLTLDVADLQPLVGTSTLTGLIFHEMGHILGFGTLWGGDLTSGLTTDSSSFTGQAAVEEYRAIGGVGNVPLETTGGDGTRDSHWAENVFDREVMTGFIEQTGTFMPLSRVTIASMADLGYTVDLTAADSFSLMVGLLAPDGLLGNLGHDHILKEPILILEEDGSSRTLDLSRQSADGR